MNDDDLWVGGEPGLGPWLETLRATVASLPAATGVRLDFTLRPGRWIDLDTLVERTVRASGWARTAEAAVATKSWGPRSGMRLRAVPARRLTGMRPPGPVELSLEWPRRPRDADTKAALHDAIAEAWAGRPPLEGPSWAEVRTGGASLLAGMEAALDCLEPVLGRDPRGRPWQRFFPFDDRIVWLRVLREPTGPPLRLRLGPTGALLPR